MCLFPRMSAVLLLVLSVTTEDAPLSPSLPPAKPSPPPPWPPLLPGTEMCDNGAPPGFVASRGARGSLDCNGGASSGGSWWYHTLWSTCGATLCTAEIDAATGCAGDQAYMRHGGNGCGCGGTNTVMCACGDGSGAGRGIGAPTSAHYVRGCDWECDAGFQRDATGNACEPSPSPPPSPPPPPPCLDTTKCKQNKCKNYNAAKLQKCKKTCGLCEPLPPSAPPSPPPPPALPKVDCSSLKDKKKCKIKMKKCKTKKQLIKCGKKCKKDKKKPKCQKTCCELGFPV